MAANRDAHRGRQYGVGVLQPDCSWRRSCGIGRKQTGTPIAPRGDDDARGNCPRRWSLFSCTVQDFSDGGLGIKINGQAQILEGQKVNLLLKRGQQEYVFPTQVARVMGNEVGLKLMPLTTQQHIDFVQCTFARADTWALWQDSYPEDKPLESLLDILKLGFRGYRHLAEFAPSSVKGIFRVLTSLVSWVVSFIPRRPERSETAQPSDQALAQQ